MIKTYLKKLLKKFVALNYGVCIDCKQPIKDDPDIKYCSYCGDIFFVKASK
jgi:predicted amidophosphoribosyltransferase